MLGGALGELGFADHSLERLGRALDAIEALVAVDGQAAHDGAFLVRRGKAHAARVEIDHLADLEFVGGKTHQRHSGTQGESALRVEGR